MAVTSYHRGLNGSIQSDGQAVHLTFEDKQIREICEQERVGRLRLGGEVFERLRMCLADLVAALSLDDLPMRASSLNATEFGLDLGLGAQLIFRPNRALASKQEKAGNDVPQSVKSIRLVRVEKHNG